MPRGINSRFGFFYCPEIGDRDEYYRFTDFRVVSTNMFSIKAMKLWDDLFHILRTPVGNYRNHLGIGVQVGEEYWSVLKADDSCRNDVTRNAHDQLVKINKFFYEETVVPHIIPCADGQVKFWFDIDKDQFNYKMYLDMKNLGAALRYYIELYSETPYKDYKSFALQNPDFILRCHVCDNAVLFDDRNVYLYIPGKELCFMCDYLNGALTPDLIKEYGREFVESIIGIAYDPFTAEGRKNLFIEAEKLAWDHTLHGNMVDNRLIPTVSGIYADFLNVYEKAFELEARLHRMDLRLHYPDTEYKKLKTDKQRKLLRKVTSDSITELKVEYFKILEKLYIKFLEIKNKLGFADLGCLSYYDFSWDGAWVICSWKYENGKIIEKTL